MPDLTENTLRGAAKALTDVVRPALDPADPLAAEQLKLVVDYLSFVRSRLDHLAERDRLELRHALRIAERVARLEDPAFRDAALQLADLHRTGTELLNAPKATPRQLRAASEAVRRELTTVIRASDTATGEGRRALFRIVLDVTGDTLRFERSWYLPYGFDPEPDSALPLAQALKL